jgi:hypothetical protein
MLFYESLGIKSHLVPWGYELVIMTIFHSLKHKERDLIFFGGYLQALEGSTQY